MSMQELTEMGKANGVSAEDCRLLFKAGMTPSLVERAKEVGLSMKSLCNLYHQHGASFPNVLASTLDAMKPCEPCEPPQPEAGENGK